MSNKWIGIASLLLALAVMLGAFGAHALKDRLDAYSLDVFHKAVFYHFVHALGLLLVVALSLSAKLPAEIFERVGMLLVCGVILFSGSLYLLALSGGKWLGAITPLGGLCFICAWLYLAWGALRS